MKRRHLFELEDCRWFPSTIRDFMTDYLRHVVKLFGMYKPVIPILDRVMTESGQHTIIDLASGGGGAWTAIAPALAEQHPQIRVILTDLYPHASALDAAAAADPERIVAHGSAVNAADVPCDLVGIRTQFLSLHHFQPEQVRQIFSNAIEASQPIAVFEFQERKVSQAIQFAFSPIFVWLFTLMIRPFSWKRLLFTYLIPIVPLSIMWDGVMSVVRTYTTDEVEEIVRSIPGAEGYRWDFGVDRTSQVPVWFVTGIPSEPRAVS